MSKKINIIVSGAKGRMGSLIVGLVEDDPGLVLAEQIDMDSDFEKSISSSDVIIDFSTREATVKNVLIAADHKKPMVIGTTGLDKKEQDKIKQASKFIPIVYAPNMSIGVNLLWKIISEATKVLMPDFQVDILEEHHVHKKDRPSGTAKKILDIIVEQSKLDSKDINISSIRKGETIGDHFVKFFNNDEIIEIRHQALNRKVFAQGAIKAAKWIVNKKPGLYDMQNVLGL